MVWFRSSQFDPGHFMHGLIFDQTIHGVDVAPEMIRIHMFFKAGKVVPGFIKNEYRRIFIVLVEIVLNATVLFSCWLQEFQQFAPDLLYGALLRYNFCHDG